MKSPNQFDVGDRVDVVQSDGYCTISNAAISGIRFIEGRPYALLEGTDVTVSFSAIKHHQNTIADVLPRSLNHAKEIARSPKAASRHPKG